MVDSTTGVQEPCNCVLEYKNHLIQSWSTKTFYCFLEYKKHWAMESKTNWLCPGIQKSFYHFLDTRIVFTISWITRIICMYSGVHEPIENLLEFQNQLRMSWSTRTIWACLWVQVAFFFTHSTYEYIHIYFWIFKHWMFICSVLICLLTRSLLSLPVV